MSAYRRQRSTETAIMTIVSDLLMACDRDQVTLSTRYYRSFCSLRYGWPKYSVL